ncbi:speckle-type POZ protein-like isoform X2 [Phymastichus coffea]|uniref:speckle-type POZ protein-like isoform X2 n=1 Tax=Phymastichus coffea TaxID=108790 RepID=UPI00273BF892|nr:speckle-type POZ protein-like isoform X2 [Phymastichus coffea]
MSGNKDEMNMTQVLVTRTYKWVIDNFSEEVMKGVPMSSHLFEYKYTFENSNIKKTYKSSWVLKLHPKANYKLSILKDNNEETNSHYASVKFDFSNLVLTHRIFRKFIKLDWILNNLKGLLSNNKLTLLFSILIQKGEKVILTEEPTFRNRLQVSNDLECFYQSKKYNDVTFIVGKEKFQVNKSIFAARSPVFFSMFNLNMKEKNEGKVNINDIDPKVFKQMVNFIYSGKLQNDEFLEELYIAADKYNIEGLKDACERSLCNSIQVDNAIDMFRFADSHNVFDLKIQVKQFITVHAPLIVTTNGFQNMDPSQIHLMKELYCSLIQKYHYTDTNQSTGNPGDSDIENETL